MLFAKYASVFCLFFYSGVALMVSFQSAYGQAEALADEYFDADQFHKAAVLYEAAFQRDTTDYPSAFRLGECYRRIFSYEKAQYYYHIVQAKAPAVFPLSVFYDALMLKYNQHCEEAIQQFDRFVEQFATSELTIYLEQAQREKQGCYLALLEKTMSPPYQFFRMDLPVNTPYYEYAPAIFRHDSLLVITSSRINSRKKRINNRSGEGFTDNVMFEKTEGWHLAEQHQHFDITNTQWSDGSGCFNSEKNKYYFTSCRDDGFCHIFVTILQDGAWQEPIALNSNINVSGTNAKHPALSAAGDTLFFISDRRGGYGGADLWMSITSGGEQWGTAMNLGPEINTPFNEISPFCVSKEHLLIFASDGHEGMGGMDIYLAEGLGTQGLLLQNLGRPFNSSRDDCYLVLGESVGYLASNRDESFDIYTFNKPAHLTVKDFLLGNFGSRVLTGAAPVYQHMITDAGTDFPLEDAGILSVRSSEKERLRNGSTRFILSSDVDDIMLDKFTRNAGPEQENARDTQGVMPAGEAFIHPDSGKVVHAYGYQVLTFSTQNISPEMKGEVSGKLVFAQSDQALKATTLNLVTADGKLTKISTTNEQGEFHFVNLEPGARYGIFVEASSISPDAALAVKHVKLQAYGDEINAFRYENIYFDFNQSSLRKEARIVLDELAGFYHQHPGLQIEINAFTDSTGDADYNFLLSQERGQSAFDYLISQGVDRSALVMNAQGVSTAIASSNSFVSQQLNRRVEFEIIGKGITFDPQYETRILKPKVDIYRLAAELHMPVEELKAINGLRQEELHAYKPIRIRKTVGEGRDDLFFDILKK